MQPQPPTLTNTRIRSTRDALQIFFAVARDILPMTTRRLDAEERRGITSGCVYVWEERCANAEATGMGMERWTDGMGWGPSRVRDEFLFYHQRENDINEDPTNPSARWASMLRRRDARPGNPSFSRSDAERLIKQTYSVHVSLPQDRARGLTRKWHLTAYFSQTTIDSLGTIDAIPNVGDVPVPEGWFKSARATKASKRGDAAANEGSRPDDRWGFGSQAPSTHPSQAQLYTVDPSDWSETNSPRRANYDIRQRSSEPLYGAPPPSTHAYSHTTAAALPGRAPPTVDTGLTPYRDASPYTHSSSSSSDRSFSPRPYSSPMTPHSTASLPLPTKADNSAPQLVPLSYLQGLQPRPRDPVDEHLLKRFTSNTSVSKTPREYARHSWTPNQGIGEGPLFERYGIKEPKETLVHAPAW